MIIILYFLNVAISLLCASGSATNPTVYPTINSAIGVGIYKTPGTYPLTIPAGYSRLFYFKIKMF